MTEEAGSEFVFAVGVLPLIEVGSQVEAGSQVELKFVVETELKSAAKTVLAIDLEEVILHQHHSKIHYSKALISGATSTQAAVPDQSHLTAVKTS